MRSRMNRPMFWFVGALAFLLIAAPGCGGGGAAAGQSAAPPGAPPAPPTPPPPPPPPQPEVTAFSPLTIDSEEPVTFRIDGRRFGTVGALATECSQTHP